MMHEQKHSEAEVKKDSTGKPYRNLPGDTDAPKRTLTRKEFIETVSNEMTQHALLNFYPSHEAMQSAIENGFFSKYLRYQNTVALHVILTVSPADIEDDAPFWHCSMSLVSMESGRPKTLDLWTKNEGRSIRDLLQNLLGERGMKNTEGFLRTKTALHYSRGLAPDEIRLLRVSEKKEIDN